MIACFQRQPQSPQAARAGYLTGGRRPRPSSTTYAPPRLLLAAVTVVAFLFCPSLRPCATDKEQEDNSRPSGLGYLGHHLGYRETEGTQRQIHVHEGIA